MDDVFASAWPSIVCISNAVALSSASLVSTAADQGDAEAQKALKILEKKTIRK